VGDVHSTIAIVARDWRGTVVLALSKKVYTTIPLQAKAEALAWALTVAADLNLKRVYFESDSKACVDSLSGASAPHWRIAGLVFDLILTVASHPHWSFVWTKREANCATHVLAGWSQRCWLW
jgi:ribonuclease HI